MTRTPHRLALAALAPAALALGLVTAGPAAAFLAQNHQQVHGDASGFTVRYFPGAKMADYWCAAGDFAISQLHVPPTTHLWRTTEERPRQAGGIGFSLQQAETSGRTGLIQIGGNDGSLSAAGAQAMCEITNKVRPGDND